jgi:hypothetical protein
MADVVCEIGAGDWYSLRWGTFSFRPFFPNHATVSHLRSFLSGDILVPYAAIVAQFRGQQLETPTLLSSLESKEIDFEATDFLPVQISCQGPNHTVVLPDARSAIYNPIGVQLSHVNININNVYVR